VTRSARPVGARLDRRRNASPEIAYRRDGFGLRPFGHWIVASKATLEHPSPRGPFMQIFIA